MMCLVTNYVIKMLRRKMIECSFFCHRLCCREDEIGIEIFLSSRYLAHAKFVFEQSLECSYCGIQYLLPVDEEQHLLRTEVLDVESREIRFSCTGSRNYQSFLGAGLSYVAQLLQGFLLHRIGFYLFDDRKIDGFYPSWNIEIISGFVIFHPFQIHDFRF